ncbi:MAG: hypothetical protein HKN70_07310 [Gammaproteobacteria bacterium]|nr:hypothetical protein [Gammaproteobacteria bacterium]
MPCALAGLPDASYMAIRQFPLIAREGWPFIIVVLLTLIISFRLSGLTMVLSCMVLLLALVLLFRDPQRDVPSKPLGVVSPVDGRVLDIAPTDKGALQRESMRFTLSVNHLGAYTVRSPTEGTVLNLMDNLAGGSRLLGTGGLWVRTDEQDDIVVLIKGPGGWARAKSFVGYGERLGQGQRFAFTRLASRVDVYVPANSKIVAKVGDRVLAGSDILSMIVHK